MDFCLHVGELPLSALLAGQDDQADYEAGGAPLCHAGSVIVLVGTQEAGSKDTCAPAVSTMGNFQLHAGELPLAALLAGCAENREAAADYEAGGAPVCVAPEREANHVPATAAQAPQDVKLERGVKSATVCHSFAAGKAKHEHEGSNVTLVGNDQENGPAAATPTALKDRLAKRLAQRIRRKQAHGRRKEQAFAAKAGRA